MNDQMNNVTRDEASRTLQVAEAAQVTTRHDVEVHAAGTIASGVVIGAFVGIMSRDYTGFEDILIPAVYLLLIVAISWWQKRAARSVPRGARRTTNRGLAVTMILGFLGIMTVNALSSLNGRHESPTVIMAAALGVVTALPTVIAGLFLRRQA